MITRGDDNFVLNLLHLAPQIPLISHHNFEQKFAIRGINVENSTRRGLAVPEAAFPRLYVVVEIIGGIVFISETGLSRRVLS